ncbi:hypothetical protein C0992_003147 [Termitomyces sp. T32_za158]|nr:hypothetical protein C0992_003147 [Termitomyces sp. T32_za158]
MSGSTSSETTSDSTSSAPLRPRTRSQRACSASIPSTSRVPRSGLQPSVEEVIEDEDSPIDPERGESEGDSDIRDNIDVAPRSPQRIHSLDNGSLRVPIMGSAPAPSQRRLAPSSVAASIVPPAPTTPFSPRRLQPSAHMPPRTPAREVLTPGARDPAASQRDPVVFSTADGFLQSVTGSRSEMVTLSRADLVDLLKSFGSSVAQALPGPSSRTQPLSGPSAVGPAFPAPSSPTPALLQAGNGAPHAPLSAVHPALHPTSVLQTGPAFTSAATSTSQAAPDGAPDMSAPLLNFNPPAAPATLTPDGVFPLLQAVPSLSSTSGPRPLLGAPPASATELDPNVMPIPLRIQRVFNTGWSTYVPLDLLTKAACHRALTASNRHGDSALSISSSGELQVSSAKFDLSKERHISAYEFMQASKTLVWVLRHCLKAGPESQIGGPTAQAIASSFETHYDRIQHRHDFGDHFPVYLAYDIYIRHAYLQSGGAIRVQDWHRLVFEKKLQDFMTDSIRRTLNQPSDLLFGDEGPRAVVEVVEAGVSHTSLQVEISRTEPLNAWSVDMTTIVSETAQGKERSYAASTDVGQIQKVSAIASLTTDPTPVPLPIVPTAMLVRSAEMANTQHRLALLDEFCPISTPLKVDRWIAALMQTDALDRFAHVIEGLQIGFSLGSLFSHVSRTFL